MGLPRTRYRLRFFHSSYYQMKEIDHSSRFQETYSHNTHVQFPERLNIKKKSKCALIYILFCMYVMYVCMYSLVSTLPHCFTHEKLQGQPVRRPSIMTMLFAKWTREHMHVLFPLIVSTHWLCTSKLLPEPITNCEAKKSTFF